jgi:hypothetical protein
MTAPLWGSQNKYFGIKGNMQEKPKWTGYIF